jgi:hypothetical protein
VVLITKAESIKALSSLGKKTYGGSMKVISAEQIGFVPPKTIEEAEEMGLEVLAWSYGEDIILSEEGWNQLKKMIENPPEPTVALKELFKKYPPK